MLTHVARFKGHQYHLPVLPTAAACESLLDKPGFESMAAVFNQQQYAVNVPFRGPMAMATYAKTELEFAPLHLSVGNDKAAQPLVTPSATAAPMLSEEQQDSGGDGLEEGLLPRLTRVLIRGSAPTPLCSGTRSALHPGQQSS